MALWRPLGGWSSATISEQDSNAWCAWAVPTDHRVGGHRPALAAIVRTAVSRSRTVAAGPGRHLASARCRPRPTRVTPGLASTRHSSQISALSCRDPLATKGDEAALIGAVGTSPRAGVAVCCRRAGVDRSDRRAPGEGLAGGGADVFCATPLHICVGQPGFDVGCSRYCTGSQKYEVHVPSGVGDRHGVGQPVSVHQFVDRAGGGPVAWRRPAGCPEVSCIERRRPSWSRGPRSPERCLHNAFCPAADRWCVRTLVDR